MNNTFAFSYTIISFFCTAFGLLFAVIHYNVRL